MNFDGISYREYAASGPRSSRTNAIASFLSFIERKLGVVAIYPLSSLPEGKIELVEPFHLANALKMAGVIRDLRRAALLCDEPRLQIWETTDSSGAVISGGMSSDNRQAIYAALAEALERHLWRNALDYYQNPKLASQSSLKASGQTSIPIKEIDLRGTATDDTKLTWIQGDSLLSGNKIYVPAQIASKARSEHSQYEPTLRESTSAGLATWSTLAGARLRGILELIEHDAFMVMWLNQLSFPRISLDSFRKSGGSLAKILESCQRYRLRVHAISMATDAPTHAICVVVEDLSDLGPRFTVGLRAHRTLSLAIEKALHEALRARIFYRTYESAEVFDQLTPPDQIKHTDRLFYWAHKKNSGHLDFLISANEQDPVPAQWEHDSEEHHLERLIQWCRECDLACISVSLGDSRINPVPWKVVKAIIPGLQPLYLDEKSRYIAADRMKQLAGHTGITLRTSPFIDRPHPFY